MGCFTLHLSPAASSPSALTDVNSNYLKTVVFTSSPVTSFGGAHEVTAVGAVKTTGEFRNAGVLSFGYFLYKHTRMCTLGAK